MTLIYFSPLYFFHIMCTFSIIILLYQDLWPMKLIKMMTLVMSVMILKQKHIKINDTQISVIVKLLDRNIMSRE